MITGIDRPATGGVFVAGEQLNDLDENAVHQPGSVVEAQSSMDVLLAPGEAERIGEVLLRVAVALVALDDALMGLPLYMSAQL